MNDELSSALAELAKGFGVSTGELWSWLQSNGVAEYAKVQVAQLTVSAVGIGIAIAVTFVITFVILRHHLKNPYTTDWADIMMAELVPSVALLVLAVIETGIVSDLVGWMASPEGMVISMLLEKVR